MLIHDEEVPRHIWRIAIVTGALPSRDSEIRRAILRIVKTNRIIKHPINKLIQIENRFQDTNQIDKPRKQKLRRGATVTGEIKTKYEC